MIYPAKDKERLKNIYIINGMHININNWRKGQRYSLTSQEVDELNEYIEDNNLWLD